jgi:hypothetical protein
MPIFKRSNNDHPLTEPEGVLWGVPRREGSSDTDDPLVHVGVVQHAFVLGQDDRALCGFKTPKYATTGDKTPRPRLALAGRDNPRCRKCTAAVALSPGHVDDELAPESAAAGPAVSFVEAAPDEVELVLPSDGAHEEVGDGVMADGSSEDGTIEPFDTAVAEPDAGSEISEASEDSEASEERPDPQTTRAAAKRRTSVRRGGHVTVPAGRRSVVVRLPSSARGSAIAAEIDGDPGDLHVQVVRMPKDGFAQVTLNRKANTSIDVVLFFVSRRSD